MTLPTERDAWGAADPTLCPICGRDACEEHLPGDPGDAPAPGDRDDDPSAPPKPNRRDHDAEAAEARAAHREHLIAQEIEREDARREARRRLDVGTRGVIVQPDMPTLAQLLDEPDPALTWRVYGWQPIESRVILAAPRKTGKTTIVASLVRSLADGDDWLGTAAVTPLAGAVAVIDTEMGRPQLKRWYREQRIVHADRVVLVSLRGSAALLNLVDADYRAAWGTWLRARGVAYLVVDCLRPVLDALGLDESREAGRWLVGLDALLREAAIPEACVVHHMGHNGERSRGDSRLRDWPDVEWRLLRQDDDDNSPRYVAAFGRDVDVPESQLAYDRLTRRLTIAGGSRHQARTTATLDAVVDVLRVTAAPLSGRGIKDALAGSGPGKDAIDAALVAGIRTGRLAVKAGPRGARLYSVSECPGVSDWPLGHSAPESVSECPTPPLGGDTPDTPPLPSIGDDPSIKRANRPDTQRRRRAAARNTPSTRHRAAEEP